MSAAASWSYTAKATLWPVLARAGWDGDETFGAPVALACDYGAKAERVTDDRGEEFVAQLQVFTERADAKPGDRLMLGTSTAADPIAAGALKVRAVRRYADTFDRKADDFELVC